MGKVFQTCHGMIRFEPLTVDSGYLKNISGYFKVFPEQKVEVLWTICKLNLKTYFFLIYLIFANIFFSSQVGERVSTCQRKS